MKKIYAMFLSMVLVSLSLSCGKGTPAQALVLFYSGTATLQHANEQPKQIQMQDIVKNGDVIETGDKSSVIVQVGDELTVRFEANTKVVISTITDIAKREITLNSGKVLSRVTKLKKGNEYFIKTPTAVASVRGTEFLTDYEGGKTIVAVGKGKVSVVKAATSEEKLVDPGKTVVISETVELRETNQVEKLELKKLENTPVLKNAEDLKTEEINEKMNPVIDRDKVLNEEIDKLMSSSGMSYEAMKAKFQRIDVITMYNGRVVKGVILSRGRELKILTPSGVVTVNAKNVKRTGVM